MTHWPIKDKSFYYSYWWFNLLYKLFSIYVQTCNAHTPSSWTLIVATHLCWPKDHRRIVPSELPDIHWKKFQTSLEFLKGVYHHHHLSEWHVTCVPSLFKTNALTLSEWPFNFINFVHVRGSQTRKIFSVEPETITVPGGFMARLYMESLFPFKEEAVKIPHLNYTLHLRKLMHRKKKSRWFDINGLTCYSVIWCR